MVQGVVVPWEAAVMTFCSTVNSSSRRCPTPPLAVLLVGVELHHPLPQMDPCIRSGM